LSAGLDQDFKELVRSHTDLVALVGESLTLHPQRGGREHKGLCPFHDDHNPSMTVSAERQSYKCWVCNEGGDCFSWVMKHDGLPFIEALRFLAERAGLEMPKTLRRGNAEGRRTKETIYDVLNWAGTQFHEFLKTGQVAERARNYVASRGFQSDTIDTFRLGFHPENWTWLLDRARGKYSAEQLLAAGLVREQTGYSGYRDDLYGRVLFPIHDERGRVVAFGGRVLPGDDEGRGPKYLNGTETAVFSKSKLLYGLDVARKAISDSGEVLVTEGYTDCITVSQHGFRNVVATLGTALTEQHVQLLRRFARKVVLVYDGDAAGQKASVRSVSKFLAQEVDLRILTLPARQDPAEFLNDRGPDAFRQLIDTAAEAWEFRLQAAVAEHTLDSMDSRHRVLEDVLELLASAPRLAGTVREDLLLAKVSRMLNVPERKLRQRLQDVRRQATSKGTHPVGAGLRAGPQGEPVGAGLRAGPPGVAQDAAATPADLSRDETIECELLEMIFAHPPLIDRAAARVSADEFGHAVLRELYELCCELWQRGVPPEYDKVTIAVEDERLKRWASAIDDRSRRKKTEEILRDDGTLDGAPPVTSVFLQLLRQFERRRRTMELATPLDGLGAAQPSGAAPTALNSSPGLTAEAKARLRELTEHRQSDPHIKLKPRSGRKR
jgi:DNA primase